MESRTASYLLQAKTSGNEQIKIMGDELMRVKVLLGEFSGQSAGILAITEELSRSATNARLVSGELDRVRQAGQSMATPLVTAITELNTNLSAFLTKEKLVVQETVKIDSAVTTAARGIGLLNSQVQRGALDMETWGKQSSAAIGVLKTGAANAGEFSREAQLLERSLKSVAAVQFKNQMGSATQATKTVNVARLDWQGGVSDEKTLATLAQLEKGYRATQAALQSEMDTLKAKGTLDEGEMARVRQLTQLQEKYGQAIRGVGAVAASINGTVQKGSIADSMVRANQVLAEAKLRTDALVASQKSGELTSKELASALNSQVISLKDSLVAIRAKIAGMESLGTMDVTQREQLQGLITAEREYAAQVLRTAAAQKEAAAAGSLRRGFAGGAGMGGNLSNAGMALSFISPEAGMISMAASMGPVIGGAAAAGLAVKKIVDLTKDGQEEAKKLQQAFLVMSANGIKDLGSINAQLDNIVKNGSNAEKMFSKSELAGALAELARGGVKGADALKTLGISAQLAAAEHIPLSEATERLYNNLQHLDMTADQAAGFGDKLARASHLSMASMDSLSQGLNVVGATAHKLGFSTEESLGALVRLGQKGMDPATIGATGLRNAMQKAINPGKEAGFIYEELGIKMRDSTGHMRLGRDIIMDLQKTFSSTRPIYNQLTGDIITQNDLTQMSFKIFGTRSATAFLNILGNLSELTDEIRNSGGFLKTYSGEVVSGLEGSQKRLDAATKNLSGTFAKLFTPALADAVTWLGKVVGEANDVAGAMQNAKGKTDEFGHMKIKAEESDLIIFLKSVYNLIKDINTGLGWMDTHLAAVSKASGLSKVGDTIVRAIPALGDHDQRARIGVEDAQKLVDQLKTSIQGAKAHIADLTAQGRTVQVQRVTADLHEEEGKLTAALDALKKAQAVYAASGGAVTSGPADPKGAPSQRMPQGANDPVVLAAFTKTGNTQADDLVSWCARWVKLTLEKAQPNAKAQIEKYMGGDANDVKNKLASADLLHHDLNNLQPGDVVVYDKNHVGVYLGNGLVRGNNEWGVKNGRNVVSNEKIHELGSIAGYARPSEIAGTGGHGGEGGTPTVNANSRPNLTGQQSDLEKQAKELYAAWVQTKASGDADPKILASVETFRKLHKTLWAKIIDDAKVTAKELKAAGVSDADYAKWIAPAQRMAQLQKSTRVGGDTERKADNQINAWIKASGGDTSAAKKVFDYEVGALNKVNQGTKEYIASTAELNKYRAEATGIAQRQLAASTSTSDAVIQASKTEVANFTRDSKVKASVLALVTESLKNQEAAEQQAAKVREAAQAGDVTLAQQELTRLTSQRDAKIALAKDSASKRLQYEKDYAQSVYQAGVDLADAQLKQAKANANDPKKTDPGNRVQALQIAENEHTQALQKALDERNARTSSARAENLAEQQKYSAAAKQLDIDVMTSSASRLKQLNDAKLESVKDNLTKVSSLTKVFAKDEYDRQVAIAAATRDAAIKTAQDAGDPNQDKIIAAAKETYKTAETAARVARDKSIADAKKAALDQQKTVAKTQLDADRALAAGRFDIAKTASQKVLNLYALEASQVGTGANEKLAFETGWQDRRLAAMNANSTALAGLEKKRLEEERNVAVNAEGLKQQAKTDLWNQYGVKIKAVDGDLAVTLLANAQTVADGVSAAQKTVTDNANKEAEATYSAWKKGVIDQLASYSEKDLIVLYSEAAAKHDLDLATATLAELDKKTSERQANEFLKTLTGSPEDQAGQITEYLAGVGRLLSPAVQTMLQQQRDQLVGAFKFTDPYGPGYIPGANGFSNQKSSGAAGQFLDAQGQGETLADRLTGANGDELRGALDEAAKFMADDSRWGVVGDALKKSIQDGLTGAEDRYTTWLDSLKTDTAAAVKAGYIPGPNGFENQRKDAGQFLDAQIQGQSLVERLTGGNGTDLRAILDETSKYMADDSKFGAVGDTLKKALQNALEDAQGRWDSFIASLKVDTAAAVDAGLIPDPNGGGFKKQSSGSSLLDVVGMTDRVRNAGATRGANGFFVRPDPGALQAAIADAQHMLDTGLTDGLPASIKDGLQTAITQGEDYLKLLGTLLSDEVSGGVVDGWERAKKNVQPLPDNAFGQLSQSIFDNADQLRTDPAMVQTFTAGIQQARTESKLTEAQLQTLLEVINQITATAPDVKSWGEDTFNTWNDKLTQLTQGLEEGTVTQEDFNTQALDSIVSLGRLADAAQATGHTDLAGYYRKSAEGLKALIKPGMDVSEVLGTLADEAGVALIGPLITLQKQFDDGAISIADFDKQALEAIPKLLALAKAAELAGRSDLADEYRQIAKELQGEVSQAGKVTAALGKMQDAAKQAQEVFKLFGQDDWAQSASDVADGIGSTMQAVGGIGKVASGDLSGIKDIIFGALNAVNSFGNAILNLDPKFKAWKKSLLEIAEVEKKNLGEKEVGNYINPYFDKLQTDIDNRTKTANATVWQRIAWWAFGGAPKIMSDEAAKSLAKMSGLFNDYAGSLGDIFRGAVGDAFSSGDWSKASANFEKSFDQKVGQLMISKLADLQLKALDLGADIQAWAEAMDRGDYAAAAAINTRIKAKISGAMNSPELQAQVSSLPGFGANKPAAGSIDEKDSQISDLQDQLKHATSQAERDKIQAQIDARTSERDAMTGAVPAGSLAEVNKKISALQEKENNATSEAERKNYHDQIDTLTKQRDRMAGTSADNKTVTDPAEERKRNQLLADYNSEHDPVKRAALGKSLLGLTPGGASGNGVGSTITLTPGKTLDWEAEFNKFRDTQNIGMQAANIQLDASKRQQDAAATMIQAAGMFLLGVQGQGRSGPDGRGQF